MKFTHRDFGFQCCHKDGYYLFRTFSFDLWAWKHVKRSPESQKPTFTCVETLRRQLRCALEWRIRDQRLFSDNSAASESHVPSSDSIRFIFDLLNKPVYCQYFLLQAESEFGNIENVLFLIKYVIIIFEIPMIANCSAEQPQPSATLAVPKAFVFSTIGKIGWVCGRNRCPLIPPPTQRHERSAGTENIIQPSPGG